MNAAPVLDLDALTGFCAGRKCFANWSPETLRDYLAFHVAQGTLCVVQTSGQVQGVAIGWQTFTQQLLAPIMRHQHLFTWRASSSIGTVIFVAEVAATSPGVLTQLCRQLALRFPEWQRKPVWTYRRGELHEFSAALKLKLLKGTTR